PDRPERPRLRRRPESPAARRPEVAARQGVQVRARAADFPGRTPCIRASRAMTRFAIRLRTRFLLVAALAVVPALTAIVFLQISERQRARARTIEENLRVVRAAAQRQAQLFDDAQSLLVRLGQYDAVRQGDAQDCSAVLANLLRAHPSYFN